MKNIWICLWWTMNDDNKFLPQTKHKHNNVWVVLKSFRGTKKEIHFEMRQETSSYWKNKDRWRRWRGRRREEVYEVFKRWQQNISHPFIHPRHPEEVRVSPSDSWHSATLRQQHSGKYTSISAGGGDVSRRSCRELCRSIFMFGFRKRCSLLSAPYMPWLHSYF